VIAVPSPGALASTDRRINQIAAQGPQPRDRSLLVSTGEPAISDDIGDQDTRHLSPAMFRRQFAASGNEVQS
jgi:hypothetical protein